MPLLMMKMRKRARRKCDCGMDLVWCLSILGKAVTYGRDWVTDVYLMYLKQASINKSFKFSKHGVLKG